MYIYQVLLIRKLQSEHIFMFLCLYFILACHRLAFSYQCNFEFSKPKGKNGQLLNQNLSLTEMPICHSVKELNDSTFHYVRLML